MTLGRDLETFLTFGNVRGPRLRTCPYERAPSLQGPNTCKGTAICKRCVIAQSSLKAIDLNHSWGPGNVWAKVLQRESRDSRKARAYHTVWKCVLPHAWLPPATWEIPSRRPFPCWSARRQAQFLEFVSSSSGIEACQVADSRGHCYPRASSDNGSARVTLQLLSRQGLREAQNQYRSTS